jgi:TRAP-type C4-dicarboxylate transport system substrate-binding protein
MQHRSLLALFVALALVLIPGAFAPLDTAGAQPPATTATTTIRLATLAPRGSAPYRLLTAWGNTLREQTGGALTLHIEASGTADERTFVHNLQSHTIDAAALTVIGLSQISGSTLVLQAPGVAEDYAQLDRVRAALDTELRADLATHGVVLLTWGEAGRGRIFSTHPITSPSDLRTSHPWQFAGDQVFGEILHQAGATGVPLGLSDVLGALGAGRVDVIAASATAVNALQWHTHLTHVIRDSHAVLIAGTVYSKPAYDALPQALRTALDTTAAQVQTRLVQQVRRDDDRAYQTLVSRGMIEVDATAHDAEWNQVAQRTRDALVGRAYSRDLLTRAMAAAGH